MTEGRRPVTDNAPNGAATNESHDAEEAELDRRLHELDTALRAYFRQRRDDPAMITAFLDKVRDQAPTPPRPGALIITTGDATKPAGAGPRIIAHVCNDLGRWGRGFVLAVSARWAAPEQRYRTWARDHEGDRLPLGQVQFVDVGPQLWVANMVAQHGISTTNGRPPIRYDALTTCLQAVVVHAIRNQATVHMPRIGCGLAGGDWSQVEPLVRTQLCDRGIPVTVYDLPTRQERLAALNADRSV